MRAVVVDNEKNALQYLMNILSKYEEITVEETFTDSCEALTYFLKNTCDVAFLDIEMPNINGVYLAEQILTLHPETKICFVTAYNDFAIKAFEINAIDYILKPYTQERVDACIKKMAATNTDMESINELSDASSYDLDIICGFDDEEVVLLKYDKIYYIEMENKNLLIHTKDKVYKGNKTLNFYEEKLKSHLFFRTHKCYIVNLEKIDKFKPRINYTYDMYFRDTKDIIPLSRNKVKELKAVLGG